MTRKHKLVNRPPHICSRGPYRRKRRHLEDLKRWDCRDYIEMAMPDVDELEWDDEGDQRDNMPELVGWAEVDPRDPKYSLFKVEVEPMPEHFETLQMFRGSCFKNAPRKQKNFWWYWLCPDCERRCRYLYTVPGGVNITCRKCWNLSYRSQSKSQTQRKRENRVKQKSLNMSHSAGVFGDKYWSKGGREICFLPPKPPSDWVPVDLLKKYHKMQKQIDSGSGNSKVKHNK